jgi:2-keto-3-deoxy-L-rhamnonate aldolase RhmA
VNPRLGGLSGHGIWVKVPAVESIEAVLLADPDFVVVDLEHSTIGLETASTLIALARGAVRVLVRVPDHAASTIQRVLDAGAHGVVVPHVDTVEQARAVVAAAHYPPAGGRGYSPNVRSGRWGADSLGLDRLQAANAEVLVVAQLESEMAVAAGVEIGEVPGVSAVFVGPADLAVSLGVAPVDGDLTSLLRSLEQRCEQRDVVLATASNHDPATVAALHLRGYAAVVVGSDVGLLVGSSRAALRGLSGLAAPARRPMTVLDPHLQETS